MKIKLFWFVFGALIGLLPTVAFLGSFTGQISGLESYNKQLLGVICSIPEPNRSSLVADVELPDDIKKHFGDDVVSATRIFRSNILQECS